MNQVNLIFAMSNGFFLFLLFFSLLGDEGTTMGKWKLIFFSLFSYYLFSNKIKIMSRKGKSV